MDYKSKNWKIIKSDIEEYILLSDSNTIKKIKGKNASDIISVLINIQEKKDLDLKLNTSFEVNKFDLEYKENIINWLSTNNFITSAKSKECKINIIGEFGNNDELINAFVNNLPESIFVNKIFDLSIPNCIDNINNTDNILTLILAPLYYNRDYIKKISELQISSKDDFLYIELYENGILLGPLMNLEKETVCLNCIEKRRIFNATSPSVIIENLISKDSDSISINNILKIGNFRNNSAFIYNELEKYLYLNKNYNKSIFIDFNKYENQHFEVMKAPNCEFCNKQVIYNPL